MNLGPAWSVVSSSPLILALFLLGGVLITTRVYQRVRWAHLSLRDRDSVRRFSGGTRSAVMARAGHRCEHHYLYRWRCTQTATLEADHVHPHSRGGSTSLGNGQVLCKRHNSLKGARIPFTWELRRLASLRKSYFPPGADPAVVRRASAPTVKGERPRSRRKQPVEGLPQVANRAAPGGDSEPITPDEVLNWWLAEYPVDLTPQQRIDFLAHPAMAALTVHDQVVVEAELRHHQKLDDLAHALECRCHFPAIA